MCLAVPGQIREVFERDGLRMARADFGGVMQEVCLAYLPDVDVGAYVLVHVGFAITELDEAAAIETLRVLSGGESTHEEGTA